MKLILIIALFALAGCSGYPITGQPIGPDDPVKGMSAATWLH